ncbi:hypothetical protein CCYA_CCYA04G1401 [Cyanidiococcus yangmingshanensis]|nr:hypothetical protein CCYA_CCYA04G1401 [Cyanidiococcus yangmingshanensis]
MEAPSSRASETASGFGAEEWLRFDLRAESELRVEVSDEIQSSAQVRLARGTAEALGRELALDQTYDLRPGTRLSFFTWHGCRLEVRGMFQVPPYVADETPAPMVLNLHSVLQRQREEARRLPRNRRSSSAPGVAIVGPHDSGKLTVAATLAAYALRHLGARLAWIDLDPGAGFGPCSRLVAVPGSLTMVSLHRPLLALEDASAFERPLCWHFGHLQSDDNRKVYLMLVEAIKQQFSAWAEQVDAKTATAASSLDGNSDPNEPGLYNAGYIAVLPAWTDTLESFDLLEATLARLSPTCVVVIESERLHALLRRARDTHTDSSSRRLAELVRIPKSGGVVPRDISARRRERSMRFHTYFYGQSRELHPHPLWVSSADLVLYRVGGRALAPITALPLGETFSDQDTAEIEILTELSDELLHAVCAVSQAAEQDVLACLQTPFPSALASALAPPERDATNETNGTNGSSTTLQPIRVGNSAVAANLLYAPVFGFVHITAVDRYRSRLRLLAPSPGKLPSKLVHVSSDLRWIE